MENGGWEDESQLQEQFLSRKGFAFNADRPGVLDDASDVHARLWTEAPTPASGVLWVGVVQCCSENLRAVSTMPPANIRP